MLKLDGGALLCALSVLESTIQIGKHNPEWWNDPRRFDFTQSQLETLIAQLRTLYVPTTLKAAERLLVAFGTDRSGPAYVNYMERLLEEVRSRLQDELSGRFLLSLESERAELFEKGSSGFGQAVVDAFPEAMTDLDEAAKCLGLTRNAATVFHLMRAMEFALHKLGDKLGARVLRDNDNSLPWGVVLANMNVKVDAMVDGPEKEAQAEILVLLRNVKDAWRNPTMHPKQAYSDEEAMEIFRAVRRFMQGLSRHV